MRSIAKTLVALAFMGTIPLGGVAAAVTPDESALIASQFDQGSGGFYTEGLGDNSARITLSGATFDAVDDYSPIAVKNTNGEVVEVLPSEVMIDGKQLKATYELESSHSVVMRVTDPRAEEKGFGDRLKCIAKNAAGGAVGGCIAGAIPTVGPGCGPGAIGGGIIGMSTGVFTC